MATRYALLAVAGAAALCGAAADTGPIPLPRALSGGAAIHEVQTGETLALIGARFGVDPAVLAERNGLGPKAGLTPGQKLTVDNRHIVPAVLGDVAIVVNVPQRMLFYVEGGALVAAYPVGLGRPDWPTPLGDFQIRSKEERPTWEVPPSIQAEMQREGRPVITVMPPGPNNPLGDFWMGLTLSSIGIHGTPARTSVYRHVTHGCIRMQPEDVAGLFARTGIGTRGRIIYAPVLLARTSDGIFLEAHRDIYRRATASPRIALAETAAATGLTDRIDWDAVDRVLRRREGIAVPVDAVGQASNVTPR